MYKYIYFTLTIFFTTSTISAQDAVTTYHKFIDVGIGTKIIAPNNILSQGTKNRFLQRSVFDISTDLDLKFSITNGIKLYTHIPFRYVSTSSAIKPPHNEFFRNASQPLDTILPSGNLIGLGNLNIGTLFRLFYNRYRYSVNIFTDISLPTGRQSLPIGLATAIPATEIRLGLSGTYSSKYSWFSKGNLAFGYRTNKYSSRIHGYIEFGYLGYHGSDIQFSFFLDGKHSLFNTQQDLPQLNNQSVHTGLYVNNQDYLALGLHVYLYFRNSLLKFSVQQNLISRNLSPIPTVGLSLERNIYRKTTKTL